MKLNRKLNQQILKFMNARKVYEEKSTILLNTTDIKPKYYYEKLTQTFMTNNGFDKIVFDEDTNYPTHNLLKKFNDNVYIAFSLHREGERYISTKDTVWLTKETNNVDKDNGQNIIKVLNNAIYETTVIYVAEEKVLTIKNTKNFDYEDDKMYVSYIFDEKLQYEILCLATKMLEMYADIIDELLEIISNLRCEKYKTILREIL